MNVFRSPIVIGFALTTVVGIGLVQPGSRKANAAESDVVPLTAPIVFASKPSCSSCSAKAVPNIAGLPVEDPCTGVFELPLAQEVHLVAIDPTTHAAVAGTWSAEFGLMTPDGTYTAPANTFAEGADYLLFSASNGSTSTFLVKLGPSTSPNASPSAPAVELVPSPPTQQGTIVNEELDESGNSTGLFESVQTVSLPFVGGVRLAVDGSGIEVVDEVEDDGVVTIDAGTAYTLPHVEYSTSVSGYLFDPDDQPVAIVIQGLQVAPNGGKKCKPLYPKKKPLGPCQNDGETKVCGEIRAKSDGDVQVNAGSMTVSGSITGKIKEIFGVDVAANATVNVTYWQQKRHYWQNCDIYECQDHNWVFVRSIHCSRICIVTKGFEPVWAALLFGHDGLHTAYESCPAWDCQAL